MELPPKNLGPNDESPSWTTADYNIWFYDPCLLIQKMIANPEFKDQFDFTPYQEYSVDGQHHFENFISGDWAWKQVVSASQIEQVHDSLCANRIKSSSITPRTRGHSLSLLFSGVTGPWCLLLPDRLTIGQYTFQLVTFTTTCSTHIETA